MVNKIYLTLLVLLALTLGIRATAKSKPVDDILVAGTIKAAKGLVYPNQDVKITYSKKVRSVHVRFTTPKSYKVKYADFYLRWRDNQWVVLQEFKKAGISVVRVTVDTNFHDGSAVLRAVHSATHVDRYAKRPNDDMWLRTGTLYSRSKDSTKWVKLDY
jgi:hypothetical protein